MSDEENGVIPALKDEKDKTKIGIAVTVIGTVVGVTMGVATGLIPYNNAVAQQTLPLFVALVGGAVGFYFGKKS